MLKNTAKTEDNNNNNHRQFPNGIAEFRIASRYLPCGDSRSMSKPSPEESPFGSAGVQE